MYWERRKNWVDTENSCREGIRHGSWIKTLSLSWLSFTGRLRLHKTRFHSHTAQHPYITLKPVLRAAPSQNDFSRPPSRRTTCKWKWKRNRKHWQSHKLYHETQRSKASYASLFNKTMPREAYRASCSDVHVGMYWACFGSPMTSHAQLWGTVLHVPPDEVLWPVGIGCTALHARGYFDRC